MTPSVTPYPEEVEMAKKTFFGSLREKDRRRYAAVQVSVRAGPAVALTMVWVAKRTPDRSSR